MSPPKNKKVVPKIAAHPEVIQALKIVGWAIYNRILDKNHLVEQIKATSTKETDEESNMD